jgi:hypothetical protein
MRLDVKHATLANGLDLAPQPARIVRFQIVLIVRQAWAKLVLNAFLLDFMALAVNALFTAIMDLMVVTGLWCDALRQAPTGTQPLTISTAQLSMETTLQALLPRPLFRSLSIIMLVA